MFFISIIFVHLFHLGLYCLLRVHHSSILVVVSHSSNCSSIKCVCCCRCIMVFLVSIEALWFMLVI